jgi:hypothetical protein
MPQDIPNNIAPLENGTAVGAAGMAGVVSIDSFKKDKENQMHKEIEAAKERLAELENNKLENDKTENKKPEDKKPENEKTEDKNIVPKIPGLQRTLISDSKNYFSEIQFNQQVETAFRSEVDSIYGKKGLLGIGKVNGLDTKEWKEMARLPANKVVEYYTSDSNKPELAQVAEKLSKSKEHNVLMGQVVGLMEKSSGVIRPFENENMEQFIKRLGGHTLRTLSQNTNTK